MTLKIACRFQGAGPRCYAHPGGPGFSSRYLGDLGSLDALFEIGFIDPRGTGESEWPNDPTAYTLDDYVEDVASVITQTSERCLLLGHSHGGCVAQRFAARYPERLCGLILADTAPRFTDAILADIERHIERRRGEPWFADAKTAMDREQAGDFADAEELGQLVAREMPFYFFRYGDRERAWVDTIMVERCNPSALRLFNQTEFLHMDLRPELASIQAKTLVITGEHDFICPPPAAREMHDHIADSQLVVVPEAGHMTFVEQPERFVAAIRDAFL